MSHSHVVKHAKAGSRQTHMNREKFNPYRHKDENQRLDSSILDTMTSLCCKRCCDIIQWKADFGKYQHMDRPKRCNVCGEKKVAIAYHRVCQQCAKDAILCAKCQKRPKLDGSAEEGKPDDSDNDSDEPRKAAAAPPDDHALAKYLFVNELDSDEEFHPYRGIDIRRLKQYKKRMTAMREKMERDQLRERERRTILRNLKKQQKDGGDNGDDIDSDEEM